MEIIKPEYQFATIGEVINVCKRYPSRNVIFSNGSPVGELGSWRGSYDIPSIDFGEKILTGEEIANKLSNDVKEMHYGYKGGEYYYSLDDEFYVDAYGSWSNQEKVCRFEVSDDTITLILEFSEY